MSAPWASPPIRIRRAVTAFWGRRALAGGHIHTVEQNPSITDGPWTAAWQFRSTILWWRFSARRGIPGEDIRHAIDNAVAFEEVGDDPVRWLVLGPDRAGNLLELVVMDRPAGPAVIHAMPMRAAYQRLLPKGRREQA
jgi:hypothetical protein